METSSIGLNGKYNDMADRFQRALEFLQSGGCEHLEAGIYPLEEGMLVEVQEYSTMAEERGFFETHDRNFDIHYMITGRERFGYRKRERLALYQAYDDEKDITFYQRPKESGYLLLEEGDYVIVSPEEGHLPRISVVESQRVRKAVIKISL